MQNKILIFGNGQLGNFYHRYFTNQKVDSKISNANINSISDIVSDIKKFNPTILLNTAAKTNLEWCAQNKLAAFEANVLGPDNLAEIADKLNLYFIHLSSGCILESKTDADFRSETDTPHPISYYSWTKVWAENMIAFKRSADFKYLILRPRQPVSAEINYKNMLLKLLTFTKFIDTPNSGTVIEDLMDWTLQLINKKATGVFHVANEGFSTPYEIGLMLKKYVLPTLPIEKITKDELNSLTPEKRVDTILDVTKLKNYVSEVRSYKDGLEDTIKKLAENFKNTDPKIVKEQLDKTVAQSKTRTVVNDVWPQLIPNNP